MFAPPSALVYGDTNSTLAGALAAAQAEIPVGHVEAGMRSFDRTMPEELNRVLTDHASDLLLCSTETAIENLKREGTGGEAHLVGDVMADVSLAFRDIAEERSTILADLGLEPGGYLVVTAHRAGNVDRRERLEALVALLEGSPVRSCSRSIPVRARGSRTAGLADRLAGLELVPPLGYLDFLELARHARAVLTDSGGVQKEAYLLGVPCLTLRDTHRVGRDRGGGLERARRPRCDAALAALERRPPAERPELYGGGHAAQRVARCSPPTLRGYESSGSSGSATSGCRWSSPSARPATR